MAQSRRQTIRRSLSDQPPVVVDTREGLPYDFSVAVVGRPVEVVRATLSTGDYSLVGFEDRVCVERKTKADLFGSLGRNRRRFESEFERMRTFETAALVVEATLKELTFPLPRSRMNPVAIVNSLISWAGRFGVQVWLAGSRYLGEILTLRILEHYWLAQAK